MKNKMMLKALVLLGIGFGACFSALGIDLVVTHSSDTGWESISCEGIYTYYNWHDWTRVTRRALSHNLMYPGQSALFRVEGVTSPRWEGLSCQINHKGLGGHDDQEARLWSGAWPSIGESCNLRAARDGDDLVAAEVCQ